MRKRIFVNKFHFNKRYFCRNLLCCLEFRWSVFLQTFCFLAIGLLIGFVVGGQLDGETSSFCPYANIGDCEFSFFGNFGALALLILLLFAICSLNIATRCLYFSFVATCVYLGYRFALSILQVFSCSIFIGVLSMVIYFLPFIFLLTATMSVLLSFQSQYWLRTCALQTCWKIWRKNFFFCLGIWLFVTCCLLVIAVIIPLFYKFVFL